MEDKNNFKSKITCVFQENEYSNEKVIKSAFLFLTIVCLTIILTACGSRLNMDNCTGNMIGGSNSKYHSVRLTLINGKMEVTDYYYKDSALSPTGVTADYSLSNKYFFDYEVNGSTITISDETGDTQIYDFELGKSNDGRELITFTPSLFGFSTEWAMTNGEEGDEINEEESHGFSDDHIHHRFDGMVGGNSESTYSGKNLSGYYDAFDQMLTYSGGVLNGNAPDFSRISLEIDNEDVTLEWYDNYYFGDLNNDGGDEYEIYWDSPPRTSNDVYKGTKMNVKSDGDLELVIEYDHEGISVYQHVYFTQ